MRLQKAPLLAATATVFLVAACGGGGGGPKVLGPGRTVIPSASEVFPLANDSADTVSPIGGVAIVGPDRTLRIVSARLSHQRRTLEGFSNGVLSGITLTRNEEDGWEDSAGNVIALSPDSSDSFIYSGLFNLTSLGNSAASGPMIIGALTPVFPSSGSFEYTGSAVIDGTDGGSTSRGYSATGVSTVTGNFSSPDVNVVIDVLPSTDVPFDQIEIINLSRSGAAFDGGSIVLSLESADVTGSVLGDVYENTASGTFFGLVEVAPDELQPAEVGGAFVGAGSNGELFGLFMAN